MAIATVHLTDHEIQTAVQDELEWTPEVDAAGVGVAVEDGCVALSGEVDSYAERIAASRAALRVRGVTAVADELVVNPPASGLVTDASLAQAIEHALRWAIAVPSSVKVTVHHGHVTLTGTVDWEYQRAAVRRAAGSVKGVTGIADHVGLSPRVSASDTSERIHAALVRNAALDAQDIHVSTAGTVVTLTGVVASAAEQRQARMAAWASPNVTSVIDELILRP